MSSIEVSKIIDPIPASDGAGVKLKRSIGVEPNYFDPFLMLDVEKLKFMELRDKLYDIFIYNLDITDCIWYVLVKIISLNLLSETQISSSIDRIYQFLYLYNNNYRPIYHLESFIFYLITQIHGFTTSM